MKALTEEIFCRVSFVICVLWEMIDLLAQTFEVPWKAEEKARRKKDPVASGGSVPSGLVLPASPEAGAASAHPLGQVAAVRTPAW